MGRPTLASHPKFAKLAARLKSRALARGVLELIWESCYASGEATVGDAEAVEALVDWSGQRGELAAALAVCGFLDAQPDATGMQADANSGQVLYVVHDLEDHAPDYVLKRWEREAKRKQAGQTIRSLRQEAARIRWKQMERRGMQVSAVVAPPAPAPAPTRDQIAREEATAPPAATPDLCRLFGRVRAREVGGLEWQAVPGDAAARRAGEMRLQLEADAGALADVEATMVLLFKNAHRREYAKWGEILKSPNFAFAVWCTEFPALREQLRGLAPAKRAALKTVEATDKKLAELRSFEGKGATPEELAELRAQRVRSA
jgi:hypothetical protein